MPYNPTSYDVLENRRDVSSIFNKIPLPGTPLLNEIVTGEAVGNTKHFWWDDVRIAHKTTLSAGYTAASGTCTVASALGIKVGSLLLMGNGQVKRVTAVNPSTGVCTIVNVAGTDANVTSGGTVTFLPSANLESSEPQDADYTQQVERFNVTQIMTDYIKMSGTQLSVNREIAGDLWQDQVARKLERLRLLMGRAIWQSARVSPSDNTAPRIMGGLPYFITANGYSPTAVAFSTGALDTFLLNMELEYGAIINELWMNPAEIGNFSGLDASYLKVDRTDQARGVYVREYISKYGHNVQLRTDPQAPVKGLYVFDKGRVILRPLKNRAMAVENIAKKGDYLQAEIVGEYTLEVNGSNSMGVFNIS